jgi:tetratricopeptide (TPR) repeat protein
LLDQQYFGSTKFHPYLLQNFVLVHAVNGEKAGDELYEHFDVNATPTVLIITPDGSEVDRVVGFGDPDRYQEDLHEAFQGEDNYINLLTRYKKNKKDLLTAFKLALKYDRMYSPEKSKKALEIYDAILKKAAEAKALTYTEKGSEEEYNLYEYTKYSQAATAMYANRQERGRKPEEFIAFVEAFPSSPLAKRAYSRIASYFSRSAPVEEGKAFFTGVLEKYPDEPDLLFSYVTFCMQKNVDLDKGVEAAEKMVELTHYSEPFYNQTYAKILAKNEDTEKLQKEYGESFVDSRLNGFLRELQYYSSFWAQQKDNLEGAREAIELAMMIKPDNSRYKSVAAGIYLKMGLEDKAMAVYGPKFVEEKKDEGMDLYSYASFWSREEKNLESALLAAQRAVELSPRHYIWNALSTVHWKMKDFNKAVEALDQALELQPSNNLYRNRMKKLKKEMAEAGN